MVSVYNERAKDLLDYVKRLNLPWRKEEELEASIARLRETLASFTAFAGLVISEPPPKQKAPMDGLGLSYAVHGEEFCNWFTNIHHYDVRKAVVGMTAYRLIKVMPFCKVEKVTCFEGYVDWLNRREELLKRKQGYLKVCPKCRNYRFTKVVSSAQIKQGEKVVGVTHQCECAGCNREWVEKNIWNKNPESRKTKQ